jgi:hypothetical protein
LRFGVVARGKCWFDLMLASGRQRTDMLRTPAHKKSLVQENPHEAEVCYSVTYDAGNNSETVHTNNAVAKNYRDGFRRSIRFWPKRHRK